VDSNDWVHQSGKGEIEKNGILSISNCVHRQTTWMSAHIEDISLQSLSEVVWLVRRSGTCPLISVMIPRSVLTLSLLKPYLHKIVAFDRQPQCSEYNRNMCSSASSSTVSQSAPNVVKKLRADIHQSLAVYKSLTAASRLCGWNMHY
jgi:hypothetical protein